MQVTEHARQRWTERFPGSSLEETYGRAQRVGNKSRKRIRDSCPAHERYMSRVFKGRYFLRTGDGVVFVMAPGETIITVFRMGAKDG